MYRIAKTPDQRKAARQMAAYFSKHLSPEALLFWTSQVLEHDVENKMNCFLHHLTGYYLPDLIKCKTEQEARKYNEDALPLLFDCMLYRNVKAGIDSVASNYKAHAIKMQSIDDRAGEFFETTHYLSQLNEIYLGIEQLKAVA